MGEVLWDPRKRTILGLLLFNFLWYRVSLYSLSRFPIHSPPFQSPSANHAGWFSDTFSKFLTLDPSSMLNGVTAAVWIGWGRSVGHWLPAWWPQGRAHSLQVSTVQLITLSHTVSQPWNVMHINNFFGIFRKLSCGKHSRSFSIFFWDFLNKHIRKHLKVNKHEIWKNHNLSQILFRFKEIYNGYGLPGILPPHRRRIILVEGNAKCHMEGGRGESWTREKVKGATAHKAGSKRPTYLTVSPVYKLW